MEIQKILSRRIYADRQSYDLVYEWEDQLAEQFGAKLAFNPGFEITDSTKPVLKTLFNCVDTLCRPFVTNKLALTFEMNPAFRRSRSINKSNVIPWVIDFYINDSKGLSTFYKRFDKHPLVLVSSKEVYDFLIEKQCPLNISHLALSISDKLRVTPTTKFEKQYDVVMMGRQNPILLDFLNKYKEKKNVSVVSCKKEKGHFNYYTFDGVFVGNADSREDCLNLLRKSRIGFYSTQGLDGDSRSARVHGFSQVTPRFLEYLATGNHVIARYADNSDVDYYKMNTICPNTQTYDDFEAQMDKALSEPVDMKLYSDYLENHYLSARIKQLKEIKIGLL